MKKKYGKNAMLKGMNLQERGLPVWSVTGRSEGIKHEREKYISGKETHKYDDIIHLPHHVSTKHPQMALLDRAAQFSPFAALTGHEDSIRETARRTEAFLELDEDKKNSLMKKMHVLQEYFSEKPEIMVTYFVPDEKKAGGAYVTHRGRIRKIDTYLRRLLFEGWNGSSHAVYFEMDGEIFGDTE